MQIADAVLTEFIAEFNEMLERLSISLASKESGGNQLELVRGIYRDIHTIKGNAMMFGLPLTGQLAHSIENLLDLIRQKNAPLTPEIINQLLNGLDYFQQISTSLSQMRGEPNLKKEIAQCVAAFEKLYDSTTEGDATAQAPTAPLAVEAKENLVKNGVDEAVQETIRVNVQVLDNIMNMVGELVLVKNQLQQRVKDSQEEEVQISQRLNSITSELQNEVMKTRMQPVGNILNKFHRICRDLASELKKDLTLDIAGAETELDRALLEAIRDPLMHIVRNCVDHGLELPEVRSRNNKSPQGKVSISAFHEGGQVIIQISDDGGGIDLERVKKKAIDTGLITAENAVRMTEKSLLALVFNPGFSTAEKVSNVSGRGVGMDVVKTNIERVGGTVELESVLGQGTTTTLRIPLTLAIIPALIIGCNEQTFAIPQGRIVELIQINPMNSNGRHLEAIEGSPFIRLRGQLIPLVSLRSMFKPDSHVAVNLLKEAETSILSIVLLSSEGSIFGTVVDEIFDSTDIVVKPMGLGLDSVKFFSGATILGDGSIALTIDVTGIAEKSRVKGKSKTQTDKMQRGASKFVAESTDYLLLQLSERGNFVIPLSTVHRIEKVAISDIQRSGGFKVCLYRDAILPLFSLSETLGYKAEDEAQEEALIIVFSRANRLYGLRVEAVLDIMTSMADIDATISERREICGGFIHESEVYTIIDPFEVIETIQGGGASRKLESYDEKIIAKRGKLRILLAEDSRFFRRQIVQFLEESGYLVVAAEDGLKALGIFSAEDAPHFDLVLSDIEMPNMTGLELAASIRKLSPGPSFPMIAITSRFSDADVTKGKSAGFNRYLEKLNRDELINNIDASLGVVS